MAESYPMHFTGNDRVPFAAWLARCRSLGTATTMNDAIRLAVKLAQAQTDDEIKKGSGKCSTSSG